MAEWWEAAPLATQPKPQATSANWWDAAPLAETPKQGVGVGEDVARSFSSGMVRSLPDLANTVAAGINTAGNYLARKIDPSVPERGFGDFAGTGQELTDATLGGEAYTPETTAGRYAKAVGTGVGAAPLGFTSIPAAGRAIVAGATGGLGGEAGGDVAAATLGEDARVYGQVAGSIAGGLAGDKLFGKGFEKGLAGEAPAAGKAPTADEIRAQANTLYKQAEEKGAVLGNGVTNSFVEKATKELTPQTEAGKLIAGETVSTKLAQRIQGLTDKHLTLAEAQEIDEYLGDVVDGMTEMGRLTKEGKRVHDLQSALRQSIENAPDTEIIGGREAIDAWKEGRQLWARQARLRDIEKIITRAEMMDNPATGIKTGFRTLYNNPQRMRGFSQEEAKLIKSAAESGAVADIMRTWGTRLLPIAGAAAGGVPGAIAGQVASMASRGAATQAQLNKALEAADLVARGGPAPTLGERAGSAIRSILPDGAATPSPAATPGLPPTILQYPSPQGGGGAPPMPAMPAMAAPPPSEAPARAARQRAINAQRGALTTPSRQLSDDLPMDTASRMRRAKEMGFIIDAYHGTGASFDEFKHTNAGAGSRESPLGHWFTDNAAAAGDFATFASRGRGANILKVKLKLNNPLVVSSYDGIKDIVDKHTKFQRDYKIQGRNLRMTGDKVDYEAAREALQAQGYDGIILRKTMVDSPDGKTPIDQYVVFDPKNIRSVNAKFDPANKDSSKLLAARPEATIAALGLGPAIGITAGGIEGGRQSPPEVGLTSRDIIEQDKAANARADEARKNYRPTLSVPNPKSSPQTDEIADLIKSLDGMVVEKEADSGFISKLFGAESSNNPTAKAKTSSAVGLGQITRGRWLELVKKYRPEMMQGKSKEQVLKLRENPKVMREMTNHGVAENAELLNKAGIPDTHGNQYLLWFLGASDGLKALRASPSTLAEKVIDADSIQANKSVLQGKTVGDVIRWAERKMGARRMAQAPDPRARIASR